MRAVIGVAGVYHRVSLGVDTVYVCGTPSGNRKTLVCSVWLKKGNSLSDRFHPQNTVFKNNNKIKKYAPIAFAY